MEFTAIKIMIIKSIVIFTMQAHAPSNAHLHPDNLNFIKSLYNLLFHWNAVLTALRPCRATSSVCITFFRKFLGTLFLLKILMKCKLWNVKYRNVLKSGNRWEICRGGMHKSSYGRLSKRRSNSPRRVLGLAVSVPI